MLGFNVEFDYFQKLSPHGAIKREACYGPFLHSDVDPSSETEKKHRGLI